VQWIFTRLFISVYQMSITSKPILTHHLWFEI